jgi:cyclic beta-1,2-glucan synthetase
MLPGHLPIRNAKTGFQVENPKRVERGVTEVSLDGKLCPERQVHLVDDGVEHQVRVVMG